MELLQKFFWLHEPPESVRDIQESQDNTFLIFMSLFNPGQHFKNH